MDDDDDDDDDAGFRFDGFNARYYDINNECCCDASFSFYLKMHTHGSYSITHKDTYRLLRQNKTANVYKTTTENTLIRHYSNLKDTHVIVFTSIRMVYK